jgi:hypothetical protein
MGSLIQFNRRPIAADRQPAPSAPAESNEERRSLRILLWTFALSAIAMCATVVFMLSPHGWRDLLWISSFMLVFALAKIALAQALFYIMVSYDDDSPANRGPGIAERAKLIPLTRDSTRTPGALAGKRAIAAAATAAGPSRHHER